MLLLASVMIAGCVDPQELEGLKTRISKLERKVAELERGLQPSSRTSSPSSQPAVEYPQWVEDGSQAKDDYIYGVGSASGIKNHALARMTADNRARAEIAKQLSPTGAATLNGVQIVDHWIHPLDGTIYSLARLPKK